MRAFFKRTLRLTFIQNDKKHAKNVPNLAILEIIIKTFLFICIEQKHLKTAKNTFALAKEFGTTQYTMVSLLGFLVTFISLSEILNQVT